MPTARSILLVVLAVGGVASVWLFLVLSAPPNWMPYCGSATQEPSANCVPVGGFSASPISNLTSGAGYAYRFSILGLSSWVRMHQLDIEVQTVQGTNVTGIELVTYLNSTGNPVAQEDPFTGSWSTGASVVLGQGTDFSIRSAHSLEGDVLFVAYGDPSHMGPNTANLHSRIP